MTVVLSEYNSDWQDMFEAEKSHLLSIIGDLLCGSVEHVGSTSVTGMIAKPVIDIMFGVNSLEDASSAIVRLVENGYCHYPYKPEVMHWFCKPSPEFRTHHLHLVPYESNLWNDRLNFKEALKTNKTYFDKYRELKQKLANTVGSDRELYTQLKGPFIQKVLNDIDN
jgi:GrpB-like predicted nucleotidyltransferase (UPF0157 family)